MDRWDVFWASWMGTAIIVDVTAWQLDKRDGIDERTLSSNSRSILGIHPRRAWAIYSTCGFVCFLGWLGVHIVFGVGHERVAQLVVDRCSEATRFSWLHGGHDIMGLEEPWTLTNSGGDS